MAGPRRTCSTGETGSDSLHGQSGGDTLDGGDGNDLLDGGSGDDTMRGGAGRDVYVVDSAGDRVEETTVGTLGGVDAVFALVDYTLPENVENLYLVELPNFPSNGTGNELDNVITGTPGPDRLRGLGGNDRLVGKDHDACWTAASAPTAWRAARATTATPSRRRRSGRREDRRRPRRIDTVFTSLDHRLAANVENLTLEGDASVGEGNGWGNRIVGNDGANRLIGWGGDDVLEGGAGLDRLNGGAGNDTAVFAVPPSYEDYYELHLLPRVIVDLGAGVMHWEQSSEPADQLISIESISTGSGDDRITGSSGANVISPGWGANLIDGGAGDDVIRAAPGAGSTSRTSRAGHRGASGRRPTTSSTATAT